jgi:hypothetical protein
MIRPWLKTCSTSVAVAISVSLAYLWTIPP